MNSASPTSVRRRMLAGLATLVLLGSSALAERIIYQFQNNFSDGRVPAAGLVLQHGKFYGTTSTGGQFGLGTVFELDPPQERGGVWTENVIYNFTSLADAHSPTSGIVFDRRGNLYGATCYGGNQRGAHGAIFQLRPPLPPSTAWTETVLYSFLRSGKTGQCPSELTFGRNGYLYGTARYGGDRGGGVVFQLRKRTDGTWAESVLHSFNSDANGFYPVAGLIADKAGNLYGATSNGGSLSCGFFGGCGTAFELQPPVAPGKAWTQVVLYRFTATNGDGGGPGTALTSDGGGGLYGTTLNGGEFCTACGTVFHISRPIVPGGSWTETVLYSFTGGDDGEFPLGSLLLDEYGNLYGSTSVGGAVTRRCSNGCGAVFRLSPPSVPGGSWTETTLHMFGTGQFARDDGANPQGGLAFGPDGRLYGTTPLLGRSNFDFTTGMVYSIHP